MQFKYNQDAFIKPPVLFAIILAIIIPAFVYFYLDAGQTEQVETVNATVASSTSSSSEVDKILIEENILAEKENISFKVTTSSDNTIFAAIKTSYPINTIDTYHISIDENNTHNLSVANYKNSQGQDSKAIIFLPRNNIESTTKKKTIAEMVEESSDSDEKPALFRYEKWQHVSEIIKKHTDEKSLFVSYWDDAQRIKLFTGRETWINGPDKNAHNKNELTLWEAVSGGFDSSGKLAKYSQILLQDADSALIALHKELPKDKDKYLLITSDILVRIQEISTLAGKGLPLETRMFPAAADLHNSISKVKEWSKEGNGTGSYLLQPVSEKFNRVWRITDKSFEDTLLARLLPFSTSLDNPFSDNTKLVYQSDWGGYMSIYQLIN